MTQIAELAVEAAGLDAGNSICNVVLGRAENRVEIPTIGLRDYILRERDEEAKRTFAQSYIVQIESQAVANSVWLVGAGVSQDPNRQLALTPKPGSLKPENETILVTSLTALALAALQFRGLDKIPKRHEMTVRIKWLSATLPYRQHRKEQKQLLKSKLLGTHRVHFLDLEGIGEFIVYLTIENMLTYPEPMPALIALAHEVRRGKVVAIRPELLENSCAVVDVGGGTSDIVVMDEGMSLNQGKSDTLEWGINQVLDQVLKDIPAGWINDRAALVDRIRREQWVLKGRGELDLRPVLEQNLRTGIAAINEILEKASKDKTIAHFILVGGGAHLMADYLTPPADCKPETPADAEWLNALGAFYASLIASEEKQ